MSLFVNLIFCTAIVKIIIICYKNNFVYYNTFLSYGYRIYTNKLVNFVGNVEYSIYKEGYTDRAIFIFIFYFSTYHNNKYNVKKICKNILYNITYN